jgi:hypothetical protein
MSFYIFNSLNYLSTATLNLSSQLAAVALHQSSVCVAHRCMMPSYQANACARVDVDAEYIGRAGSRGSPSSRGSSMRRGRPPGARPALRAGGPGARPVAPRRSPGTQSLVARCTASRRMNLERFCVCVCVCVCVCLPFPRTEVPLAATYLGHIVYMGRGVSGFLLPCAGSETNSCRWIRNGRHRT